MSTFVYPNARSLFATGGLNWPTLNVRAMFVDGSYAPLPGDLHVSDVPSAAIVARASGLMTGLAQVSGVCSGQIPQFNALLSTKTAAALVLYRDTGTDSTSELLYYSSDGIGFPFVPVGINYFVGYDQTNGGWFAV